MLAPSLELNFSKYQKEITNYSIYSLKCLGLSVAEGLENLKTSQI